jgi:hypothetical protein
MSDLTNSGPAATPENALESSDHNRLQPRRQSHPRRMRGNSPSRDSGRSYLAWVSVLGKDYGLAQGSGWAAWLQGRHSGITALREGC